MVNLVDTNNNLGLTPNAALKGSVHIRVLDKDKNILEDKTVSNNIVIGIRKPIITLLSGFNKAYESLPFVTTLMLGDCVVDGEVLNQDVSVEDADLFHRIEGSAKNTATAPVISDDGYRVTFAFLYSAADTSINYSSTNLVVIREMGLFTRDGIMVAHTKVGEWKKETGVFFEVYWTIGYSSTIETE